jgi:uncharacterized protein (TIGR03067 family)
VTAIFLGLALVAAAPASKEGPKKGAPIVGEWAAVPVSEGGSVDLPPDGTTLTFTRDGKCLMKKGANKPEEWLYLTSPNKTPAEVDISEPGPRGERPIRGIYKVDGDTLILCLGLDGTRPTDVGKSAGGSALRITLKRVRPD